jgi:hypothetical protein
MVVQNVTITGCNLEGCSQYGLSIDSSGGGSIAGVSVVGNTFWGYSSSLPVAVYFAGSSNSNLHIADNPGYNPVGAGITPPLTAGTAVPNPFPQPVRIYVVSTSITSIVITSAAGVATVTGIVPTNNGTFVALGVGESITVHPSEILNSSWKWFPL